MRGYNIIGDIHGYASHLVKLLEKMGYQLINGVYIHPEQIKVVFVGDYIDRGNQEKSVIDIVKAMVEAGSAIALMGNHEYNAICYATKMNGEYLRKHTKKNTMQHQAFLDEYPFGSPEYLETIEWFKTLPIFFEEGELRVVHAAWVSSEVEKIKPLLNNDNTITEALLVEVEKENWVYDSMEVLLKGVEYTLPNNMEWKDKDGVGRNTMRFNWFKPVDKVTYKNCALSIPDYVDLPDELIENAEPPYNEKEVVFFGHYWMTGTPKTETNKIACVDYSVAKGGSLVAYQWRGETELTEDNFRY